MTDMAGRPLTSDAISEYLSRSEKHRVNVVTSCSESVYVQCACGEKVYGFDEREARARHRTHRSA